MPRPHAYKTVEPHPDHGWAVYLHDTYPKGSVLEGEDRRMFLGGYRILEEAQEDHPDAEIVQGSTRVDFNLPRTPPPWFDPAAAGERWDDNY